MQSRSAPWILVLIVIVADQVTKYIVMSSMKLHQSISVIGDTLRWTYVQNSGMAFSIKLLEGRLLGIISIIATIVFAFILIKSRREAPMFQLIIGAIIGGAIGNSIDRLRFGYVIDFIDVNLPDWWMDRWPVFNIADSAVSVSVVLLISIIILRPGFMMASPSTVVETDIQDGLNSNFDIETNEQYEPGNSSESSNMKGNQD
ncbi:MAG: signal peptidase II [Candidatus Electryonea clarkiae]|nr:signal peptidase II [Candidatus Electryonea clarkiae]MDP8288270.1 signal peptidase II [Candidatus Electryonea clarkiae]